MASNMMLAFLKKPQITYKKINEGLYVVWNSQFNEQRRAAVQHLQTLPSDPKIGQKEVEMDALCANFAGFDVDKTLILPKSGAKHPKDATDWQFRFPNVVETLRNLHEQGFNIVLFTNQAFINGKRGFSQQKETEIMVKLSAVLSRFDFACVALVAGAHDNYRKPNVGSFNFYASQIANRGERAASRGAAPPRAAECSFFVGDAAGRPSDFSDSDKKFAERIGVTFYTPESIFEPQAAAASGGAHRPANPAGAAGAPAAAKPARKRRRTPQGVSEYGSRDDEDEKSEESLGGSAKKEERGRLGGGAGGTGGGGGGGGDGSGGGDGGGHAEVSVQSVVSVKLSEQSAIIGADESVGRVRKRGALGEPPELSSSN